MCYMTGIDLIRFRRKFDLTQQKCAEALGCSVRAVSNWECRNKEVPESVALAASAYAHGLKPWISCI